MPESIEKALEKLKYSGLNPQDRQEYEKEAELIDSYSKALEHAETKGELKGELKGKLEGKLEGLLNGYIDFNFQKISPTTIRQIKESNTLLPKNELMKIGSRYVEEGKITQEQLENFIRLVDQEGILANPVLKTPIDE
jgi:LPS O-antigen subunit length determinant protein (WzzB/FepE family)